MTDEKDGPVADDGTHTDPGPATLAARFHTLFAGLERAHGAYQVDPANRDETGKIKGTAVTLEEPVTDQLWIDHLTGKKGLGIIPIRDDHTVTFGAIDIDQYNLHTAHVAVTIARLQLPLFPCRTKSGGIHAYCFTSAPVTAAKMQKKLTEIAALLGFGGSEIFPKQTKILADRGDKGSWINMPYFDGDRTTRYALRRDGEALSMIEFLDLAEQLKAAPAWFNTALPACADLADGPPCLQHLATLGFPEGTRNNALFNIGIYLKKRYPDDWKRLLDEYNRKLMQPPLGTAEVQELIISVGKKGYNYRCSDQPIAPHCNRQECVTRKFGVGNSGVMLPALGGMTKLLTSPPLWFWSIENERLEFTTAELLDPLAFQRKCADRLSRAPAVPKRAEWARIVDKHMRETEEIHLPEDGSVNSQLMELLEKFCTRRMTDRKDEILLGKPWHDESTNSIYLRLEDFMAFLKREQFKECGQQKVIAFLHTLATGNEQVNTKGKNRRCWVLPASIFEQQTEPLDLPPAISKDVKPY